MRPIAAIPLTLGTLWLGACAGAGPATRTRSAATGRDPRTAQALLRIARRFNDDYSANRVDAVYDRWDARSCPKYVAAVGCAAH